MSQVSCSFNSHLFRMFTVHSPSQNHFSSFSSPHETESRKKVVRLRVRKGVRKRSHVHLGNSKKLQSAVPLVGDARNTNFMTLLFQRQCAQVRSEPQGSFSNLLFAGLCFLFGGWGCTRKETLSCMCFKLNSCFSFQLK